MQPVYQVGARMGQATYACDIPYMNGTSLQYFSCRVVGMGGIGWLPGQYLPDPDIAMLRSMCAPLHGELSATILSGTGLPVDVWYNQSNGGTPNSNEYAARTDRRGGRAYHTQQLYSPGTIYLCTNGAPGYGAGGSGNWQYSCAGANAGVVAQASIRLTSTANIAVTVGNGGDGGIYGKFYGGGGARGCVAVFW